ncbi:MAG: DUF4340 domain-containing protein [Acidobacteria bacterium]|nr:DUF4340 domain-containing protein [Acidobacteriota bacterium]
MRFKGTLVLLIVGLALGAYVYFYEIGGGEQREKAKQAEKQVWKLESSDISRVDLVSAEEHITVVRKGEDEWTLTAPRSYEADTDEMERLAIAASNILRENIIEENASSLGQFGLDPAQSSLKVSTIDGKEYGIDFGHRNPTGNSVYAALPGKKEVFLVSSAVAETFEKKTNELRNQRVLKFKQPEVESLSLKSPKGDIQLMKDEDDQWWLTHPEKVAADSPGIRGILNALSMARVKEFFDKVPGDQSKPGLNKPFIDVRLTYGKDKAARHLLIGAERSSSDGTEMYLAKDESREDLFFVDKDLVDKLLKSHADVREKALATFQRWNVNFISLTNSKGSFTFRKTGGEWLVGQEGTRKANWEAMNAILDAMEKPVNRWIDKPAPLSTYGLDKPLIRVILKQGSRVMADCSFGKADKEGGVYAQLRGVSAVKVVDPEVIEALDKGEPDFVEASTENTEK